MKDKILQKLKEGKIFITELPLLFPEIKGEYSVYMPVKEGFNKNILWLSNVSQDFIKVFNELLIEKKLIDVINEPIDELIFYSKPIYGLPRINKTRMKNQKHCWMPVSIIFKGN